MRRDRNPLDSQQPNTLGILHADLFRVRELGWRKTHAFAQNAAFLFGGPLDG